MRQAVAASAGTFAVAMSVGLAAFAYGTPPGIPTAGEVVAALTGQPSLELRAGQHRLRTQPREAALVSVIPVNEQALATSREIEVAAEPIPTPTPTPQATEVARSAAERPAAPPLEAGDRAEATLSFYYCEQGDESLPLGDGGGFCGKMRNGTVVHEGAAACDVAYLGQRFRIEGDPLEREYVCADTGSAVHGLHRDIWFHSSDEGWGWQQQVGRRAVIEIVD